MPDAARSGLVQAGPPGRQVQGHARVGQGTAVQPWADNGEDLRHGLGEGLSGMCTVTGELPSVTTSGRAVMVDMVTSLLQSVAPGAVPAAHPHAPVVRDALRAPCRLFSNLVTKVSYGELSSAR